MKKKIIIPSLILPFIALFSNIVSAQNYGPGEALRQVLLPLLQMIGVAINAVFSLSIEANLFISYIKFSLFVLLLAIIIFAASLIFPQRRGLAFVVAAIVSFISVIAIPADVIWAIVGTYSALYASILLFIPVLGVWFLMFMIPVTTKYTYFLKAAFMFILFCVMISVHSYLLTGGTGMFPGTPGLEFTAPMGWLIGAAELVTLILFGYYLGKGFFTKESAIQTRRAQRQLWRGVRGWMTRITGEEAEREERRGGQLRP